MSNTSLRTIFSAFVGNAEASIVVVADALTAAVVTCAMHGTYAPLADALSSLSSIKGRARMVDALRAGIVATGLSVDAKGRVIGAGLRVGKMNDSDAHAYAGELCDAFTLAASTVLTTVVPKATMSDLDKAAKALTLLATLDLRTLAKALATNDGATLKSQIALIHSMAVDKAAKVSAKARGEVTDDATKAATPAEAPATV